MGVIPGDTAFPAAAQTAKWQALNGKPGTDPRKQQNGKARHEPGATDGQRAGGIVPAPAYAWPLAWHRCSRWRTRSVSLGQGLLLDHA